MKKKNNQIEEKKRKRWRFFCEIGYDFCGRTTIKKPYIAEIKLLYQLIGNLATEWHRRDRDSMADFLTV